MIRNILQHVVLKTTKNNLYWTGRTNQFDKTIFWLSKSKLSAYLVSPKEAEYYLQKLNSTKILHGYHFDIDDDICMGDIENIHMTLSKQFDSVIPGQRRI